MMSMSDAIRHAEMEENLHRHFDMTDLKIRNLALSEEFANMFRENMPYTPENVMDGKKKELVDTFSELLEEVLTDAYNSGYEKGLIDGSPYRS